MQIKRKNAKIRASYEVENAESEYIRSGDAHFILIAIGKWPHKPPAWVIEACIKYRNEYEASTSNASKPLQTGRVLDYMISRFFFEWDDDMRVNCGVNEDYNPPSLRSVMLEALEKSANVPPSHPDIETELKFVERAWKKEAEAALGNMIGFSGVPRTERAMRMGAIYLRDVHGKANPEASVEAYLAEKSDN